MKKLTLADTDATSLRRLVQSGRWFAYDSETWAITPGQLAPPLVCSTVCGPALAESSAQIMLKSETLTKMAATLADKTITVVGHNLAFDLAVLVAAKPAQFLLPVFRAYEEGRIVDTMIIEQLRKIARGWTKFDPRTGTRPKFSLEYLVSEYLGEKLEGKHDGESWRLRFKELDGQALVHWPIEAKLYALNDAEYTAKVFLRQMEQVAVDAVFASTLVDLRRQCMEAFALHMMSAWGFRTDTTSLDLLEHDLHQHVDAAVQELLSKGLYQQKGKRVLKAPSRNMEAIRRLVTESFAERGEMPGYTAGGTKPKVNGSLAPAQVKTDEETLRSAMHPDLLKLADIGADQKLLTTYVPVLRMGTQWPINPRYNVLVDTGRTSSSRPNIQNQPRRGGVRECFVPQPGYLYVACDYHTAELRSLAQSCLDRFHFSEMAEAFKQTPEYPHGKDLHLVMAANILGTDYKDADSRKKERDVKDARQLAKCFHPDTEVLTPLGWVRLSALPANTPIATPRVSFGGEVTLDWAVPLRRTHRQYDGRLVHLYNEGIDLLVTPDHRMIGFRKQKTSMLPGEAYECTPSTLGNARYWPNAGHLKTTAALPIAPALLQLIVATQADGSYCDKAAAIRFGFTKQRKIDRLRLLLQATKMLYTETTTPLGVQTFYIPAAQGALLRTYLTEKKGFLPSWITALSSEQRELFLQEVSFWDGSVNKHWTMRTHVNTNAASVDIVQAIATLAGRKTRQSADASSSRKNACYKLSIKDHHLTRGGNLRSTTVPYTGRVYCVTTSTDAVLVRAGASKVPVITHQCANFGFPGGLGYNKFKEFAWKAYNLKLDDEMSKKLKARWLQSYPEMRQHFAEAAGLTANGARFTHKQRRSGRMRGGVGYCDSLNTEFQGLTADGAKLACWAVVKESWTGWTWDEPIPDDAKGFGPSPLLGFRPNGFIHDEIIGEAPYGKFRQHAQRLSEVMVEAMRWFLPDVPVLADAHAMYRWFKDAEPVYDGAGQLVPWEPPDPKKLLLQRKSDHPLLAVLEWTDEHCAQLQAEFADVNWKYARRVFLLNAFSKDASQKQ